MTKYFLLFITTIGLVSCTQKPQADDLPFINGYWEIAEVNTAENETKLYEQNTTVDYIELKDSVGFRQKLMPQFDGKYRTNQIKEKLKLTSQDGVFYLHCSTEYADWKEEIIAIDSTHLTLKNDRGITYKYQRFSSINIARDE